MRYIIAFICSVSLGVWSLAGLAAEVPAGVRHGAISVHVTGIALDVATVITLQHADDSRSRDELLASLGIVSTFPAQNGQWLLYVESDTTPVAANSEQRLRPEGYGQRPQCQHHQRSIQPYLLRSQA